MSINNASANLLGRAIISGKIVAKTGLHIGGSQGGIDIGGVDSYVIRDPLTMQPYIPGSSLKGKLRSLLEKRYNLPQNNPVGRAYIHLCKTRSQFESCKVCPVFGISAEEIKEEGSANERLLALTRIVVRDAMLDGESAKQLKELRMDLQYTEVKTEVVIDRLTSAAVPRTIERVPAGAIFNFEIVYSFYDTKDFNRFMVIPEAMQLLEDDYLGGLGSRGSGQVRFQMIKLVGRKATAYRSPIFEIIYDSMDKMIFDSEAIASKIAQLAS